MAGETEQPYNHKFQAESLHSGSISFGRFQGELFAWEHRSLFSHNRYLEEVKQCAKPGFVIARKAYFEEHFRRKALLRQGSAKDSGEGARSGEDNLSGKEDDKGKSSVGDESGIGSTNVSPKVDLIKQHEGLTVTEPVRCQIFSTIEAQVEAQENDDACCVTEPFEHSDVEMGTEIGTGCENNQVNAYEEDDNGCVPEPVRCQIFSIDNPIEAQVEAHESDDVCCVTEPFEYSDVEMGAEIGTGCESNQVKAYGDDDNGCIPEHVRCQIFSIDNPIQAQVEAHENDDIHCVTEPFEHSDVEMGPEIGSGCENNQVKAYEDDDGGCITEPSKYSELGNATKVGNECDAYVDDVVQSITEPFKHCDLGSAIEIDAEFENTLVGDDGCCMTMPSKYFVIGSATDIDTACEYTKRVDVASGESLNSAKCSSNEDQQSILDGNSDSVFRNVRADSKFSECDPSPSIILGNSDKGKGNPMHEILCEYEQTIEVKQTVIESVHKKVSYDNDFSKKKPEDMIYDISLDNNSVPSFKPLSEIKAPKINSKSPKNVRETERSTIGLHAGTMNTRKKVVETSRTKMPKKPSQNRISSVNLLCGSLKVDGSVPNHGRSNNTSKPSKPEVRRSVATFNFRSDERAEKRKEFFSKLEQKVHEKQVLLQHMEAKHKEREHAEMKQYRRSLNFKANPMPSFYREAARQCSVKQSAVGNVSTKVGSRSPAIGSKPANGRIERTLAFSTSSLIPKNEKARPRSAVRQGPAPKVDSKNGGSRYV